MELALNLVWVLICAGTLCFWARHARIQRRVHSSLVHDAVLLAGVLFILFPYISATDDLQAGTVFVEDSTFSARKSRACTATRGGHSDSPTVFVAAVCPLISPFPVAVEAVVTFDTAAVSAPAARSHSGRAPPFALSHS